MIITVSNTKGGVGKTTCVANLGGYLADHGHRVLAVDADIQPALSSYFELTHNAPRGLLHLITQADTVDVVSTTAIEGLDLIYSDDPRGSLQNFILHTADGRHRLKHTLSQLHPQYDFILIDTQGAAGPLQDSAIFAGDLILTPLRPDRVSAQELQRGRKRVQEGGRALEPMEVEDKEAEEPDARKTVMLMMRHYNVFNREQLEGLPETTRKPVSGKAWDSVERVDEVVRASKAEITYGDDRACYAPVVDRIRMPAKAAFKEPGEFYSTQFHELTHWTGHQSRLAREYGNSAYAREELVAEMGAAFLCSTVGIAGHLQHPEYISSWLSVLREDKRAVITAASHAQKASDWLLQQLEPEESDP